MNKKLIAIAIATAVSAPAMAATSNVEVYGLMSMGVDSVNTDLLNGTSNRVGRVSDYASRIGFKGNEDLGNGLKAVWQIESGVTADGGTAAGNATNGSTSTATAGTGSIGGATTAFGGAALRNTFVGLSDQALGTVMIGKIDTPYKSSTGRLDQFSDTLGDYNNLVGAASGVAATSYFDLRPANVAAYATPNFSGFSAVAGYVFGGESATSGTASNGNAYSLGAMYDAGPLYLTAAYEKHNLGSGASGSLSTGLATAGLERKAWKLGAAYSIMDFTLATMYEKTDDNLGAAGVSAYGHNTWFLSGKYQMGAVALKAQYAKAGEIDNVANSGAKMYTVGADYGFSKRTTAYVLYTKISNDAAANYNFAYNAAPGSAAGADVAGFSLGMKHSF
ncbi:porin [Sulfuriferula nivalis]|nr:porin [Sulfuriferula nivalis]